MTTISRSAIRPDFTTFIAGHYSGIFEEWNRHLEFLARQLDEVRDFAEDPVVRIWWDGGDDNHGSHYIVTESHTFDTPVEPGKIAPNLYFLDIDKVPGPKDLVDPFDPNRGEGRVIYRWKSNLAPSDRRHSSGHLSICTISPGYTSEAEFRSTIGTGLIKKWESRKYYISRYPESMIFDTAKKNDPNEPSALQLLDLKRSLVVLTAQRVGQSPIVLQQEMSAETFLNGEPLKEAKFKMAEEMLRIYHRSDDIDALYESVPTVFI